MKVESEIKKWGNSLALRVTGVMAELPKFSAGTKVIIEVTEEGFMVKPAPQVKGMSQLPYSEAELLADLDPQQAHADELAQPSRSELGD
jgi:antitoxin MazE